MFAVQWHAAARRADPDAFQARQRRLEGMDADAADCGHGPDDGAGALVGEPHWATSTRRIQLRAPAGAHGVLLHVLSSETLIDAHAAGSLALATPRLAAGAGQPAIIARRAWAGSHSVPRVAPQYGHVQFAVVHHTDSQNGYSAEQVPAMIRGIYIFHRFVRGWDDIGYNFVADLYGRVWEARAGGIDQAVVGAQAGGFNLFSTGIAVIGNFQSVDVRLTRQACARRAGRLEAGAARSAVTRTRRGAPERASASQYSQFPRPGSRVSVPRIAGHRDVDSDGLPRAGALRRLGGAACAGPGCIPAPGVADARRRAEIDARAGRCVPAGSPRLLAGRLTGS